MQEARACSIFPVKLILTVKLRTLICSLFCVKELGRATENSLIPHDSFVLR